MKTWFIISALLLSSCAIQEPQRTIHAAPTAQDYLERADCIHKQVAQRLSKISGPPYGLDSIAIAAAAICGANIEEKLARRYSIRDPRYIDEPRRDRDASERHALAIAVDMIATRSRDANK